MEASVWDVAFRFVLVRLGGLLADRAVLIPFVAGWS
jgi:hypothetical protein